MMIGCSRARISVGWRLFETLLQVTVSFVLLVQPSRVSTAAAAAALVSVSGGLAGVTSNLPKVKFMDTLTPTVGKPYFEDIGPRNVTAIVGQSVTLKCRVRHPGDRTVSWMRKRDLHILTSSIHTYTGDGRFSVMHPEDSDDWDLRIEYVQKRDAGVYECQVNTEPKINMAVMLNVEESSSVSGSYSSSKQPNYQRDAQASIWGSQDVYVKKGSTISLTCSVNVQSIPPSSVQWFHGAAAVDFDSQRGGISLETEKTDMGVTSKLLITNAALSDSGNYTCVPSNSGPASVFVHVLIGENPAAMQSHAKRSTHFSSALLIYHTAIVVLFIHR